MSFMRPSQACSVEASFSNLRHSNSIHKYRFPFEDVARAFVSDMQTSFAEPNAIQVRSSCPAEPTNMVRVGVFGQVMVPCKNYKLILLVSQIVYCWQRR